jgi:HK97 family phage portal protein
MSFLFRSRTPSAAIEDRSGSFSLRQLAIAMAADGGSPAVSSIEEACRDAATWACLHIKAKNIASLPVDQIRYQGDRRIEVPKSAVIRRPSMQVPTLRYWIYQLAWSTFADGNSFGLVTAVDSMVRPSQIDLLAPEDVTERTVKDGIPQARVKGVGVMQVFPFGDLWHMPGEVVAPGSPFGLSPISYGSRVTGTALAAERFGGQFFTRGGHPTGVLTVPGQPTEQQSKDLLAWLTSKDKREPLVLPQGTTYETISVSPEDSQFIELMRYTVEQTCRRHGVPPSMVYAAVSGQSVTYANVSQADLAFLKHTLSYPIDLIEDALSALIPAPQVIKLNRDAILEGDPETRERIWDLQLKNKTRTVNEVRAMRDEDPLGDEYDTPGIPGAAPQPAMPDPTNEGGAAA